MKKLVLGLLAFVAGAGVVLAAGPVLEAYRELATAPTAYRSGLTGADAVDLDTPIDREAISSNTTLAVTATFSTSGASATLTVVLYHGTTPIGIQQGAFLATTYTTGSRYMAETLYFDLSSATHYEIRTGAPSAGNVTILPWTFGVSPSGSSS